jgi:ribosomal protein S18 acetylase RimI-like enzyme
MLKIRPFQSSDQDVVKTLVLAGLAERFNLFKPELNKDLDDIAKNFDVFLVGYVNDVLAVTGGLHIQSQTTAKVVRMSTAKSYRQCGFAARVLKELEQIVLSRGIRHLTLVTNEDWVEAVRFYEGYGFLKVEDYIDATGSQGVRFHKDLHLVS